jgi:hypothetical protein
MFGLASQGFMLMLLVFLLETKRKGGEVLWQHRVGTTLAATANLLSNESNAKRIQGLIFTALNGDTKISFTELQELSIAMSALDVSITPTTNSNRPLSQ